MRAESIVFAIAGTLFGLIVGWILGSQQAGSAARVAAPAAAAATGCGARPAAAAAARRARREPRPGAAHGGRAESAGHRRRASQLGNIYFDAERYTDAITWYEDALKLKPSDADVSTDLGVAYYYTNQPDRAVKQFEHSLAIDPKHTKTLLNMGIVKAFGKQDLERRRRRVAAGRLARSGHTRRAGREESARRAAERASRRRHRGPEAGRSCWARAHVPALPAAARRSRARCCASVGGVVQGATARPDRRRREARIRRRSDEDDSGSRLRHLRRSRARRCSSSRGRETLFFCSDACRQKYLAHHDGARMTRAEEQIRADIVEVGRRLWQRGYVASNDGNISVRLDDGRLITTPKNVSKGFMTPDMMVVTDFDGQEARRRARSVVRAEDAPAGVPRSPRRARRGARASADRDRLCRRRHSARSRGARRGRDDARQHSDCRVRDAVDRRIAGGVQQVSEGARRACCSPITARWRSARTC